MDSAANRLVVGGADDKETTASLAAQRIEPYRDEDFDDEGFVLTCTWCGGEGEFFGNELPGYDPGWHDPERVYDCPACGGSGERRDQRVF